MCYLLATPLLGTEMFRQKYLLVMCWNSTYSKGISIRITSILEHVGTTPFGIFNSPRKVAAQRKVK